jgi:hypothetical protein
MMPIGSTRHGERRNCRTLSLISCSLRRTDRQPPELALDRQPLAAGFLLPGAFAFDALPTDRPPAIDLRLFQGRTFS